MVLIVADAGKLDCDKTFIQAADSAKTYASIKLKS